jgi:hypothetical protein
MREKSPAKKLDDLALENRTLDPMEKGPISRPGKMRDRISIVNAQARWKGTISWLSVKRLQVLDEFAPTVTEYMSVGQLMQ